MRASLPPTKLVKFTYCTNIQLDPDNSTAKLKLHAFNPFDCYNPDVTTGIPTTGISHQPMAWDQWKVLYEEYIVLAAHITVEQYPQYANLNTGNTQPAYWFCKLMSREKEIELLDDDDDVEILRERKLIPRGKLAGTAGQSSTFMSAHFNARNWFKPEYRPEQMYADVDTDDSIITQFNARTNQHDMEFRKTPRFILAAYSPPAVDGSSLYFRIKIHYTVKFHNPKAVAQS